MAPRALALYVLYLALAFGGRTLLQLRSTGSTGFKGISGHTFSAEWTGGVLFVAAFLLGLAAPVLGLAGALEPLAPLDGSVGHALGLILFFAGLCGTLLAQLAMDASWRIGVDEAERTELVTGGPFALVRNPIFSAMVPAFLGLVLLVPNVAALAGLAALVVARVRSPSCLLL
jgi:protein-S-isoprenylcysteine O-methyltransferase Ste14